MLEHIFRNVSDIRIFDLMTDLPEEDVTGDLGSVDIDDIMNILDYPEYKRIEIEDSIEHLVREHVLDVKQVEVETKTGCRTCKITDKLGIPRFNSHKNHIAEKKGVGNVNAYYIQDNDMTRALRAAIYANVSLNLDQYTEE